MVDVPIHQEDLAVQRTPLIDPVISMVTEKTASTPTPPTTQAHVQMFRPLIGKNIFKRSLEVFVEQENKTDKILVAEKTTQAGTPPSMCQTISNIDAHVEGEQFHESKQSRRSSLRTASAAAKPCQGDSSEVYLITGSIYTD
ncbi:hypothetical protein Tco_0215835 [Tanacetum coccineum]